VEVTKQVKVKKSIMKWL